MSVTRQAALGLLTIAFGVVSTPMSAQTVEQFYQGKTVTMMVGFSAGDGTDTWARLIARFMSARMPGRPQFVVANLPGAGSLLLANQLANTQPRDGTVLGAINRGMPFEPLLGSAPTQFDALKMNWLGSPDRDTAVCAARNDAPVKSLDDLTRQELIVGSTGSGADTATIPAILREVLGLRFRPVTGYPGSRDILLAIERGEVQGICVNHDSLVREPQFRDGKVRILFQAASKSDSRLEAYPVASDIAQSDAQRQALQLFFVRAEIGRPFVAPPGVPTERLAALRQAFAETLADPDLKIEAEKVGLNLRPVSASDTQGIIAKTYQTPPDVVARMKRSFGRMQ
jgi:tripartite-type tricarboxylate transporter receptor subunit TctC